jgi:hypothetical protein
VQLPEGDINLLYSFGVKTALKISIRQLHALGKGKPDAVVEISPLRLFSLLFSGHIKVARIDDADYYAFMCKRHGLQTDLLHGYRDGELYHECGQEDGGVRCGFTLLVGDG